MPYFIANRLKNHTLCACAFLNSLCKKVPPPPGHHHHYKGTVVSYPAITRSHSSNAPSRLQLTSHVRFRCFHWAINLCWPSTTHANTRTIELHSHDTFHRHHERLSATIDRLVNSPNVSARGPRVENQIDCGHFGFGKTQFILRHNKNIENCFVPENSFCSRLIYW